MVFSGVENEGEDSADKDVIAAALRRAALEGRSYIGKGIWRQGMGSLARGSYVSALRPVGMCPLLVHF